mmetsp:Transcript_3995/g.11719  ORF Transcript_3995/g.11719 Transcript_3995/m.11719 type:complete len:289 (+) Transcript_3995:983-1849(+)
MRARPAQALPANRLPRAVQRLPVADAQLLLPFRLCGVQVQLPVPLRGGAQLRTQGGGLCGLGDGRGRYVCAGRASPRRQQTARRAQNARPVDGQHFGWIRRARTGLLLLLPRSVPLAHRHRLRACSPLHLHPLRRGAGGAGRDAGRCWVDRPLRPGLRASGGRAAARLHRPVRSHGLHRRQPRRRVHPLPRLHHRPLLDGRPALLSLLAPAGERWGSRLRGCQRRGRGGGGREDRPARRSVAPQGARRHRRIKDQGRRPGQASDNEVSSRRPVYAERHVHCALRSQVL